MFHIGLIIIRQQYISLESVDKDRTSSYGHFHRTRTPFDSTANFEKMGGEIGAVFFINGYVNATQVNDAYLANQFTEDSGEFKERELYDNLIIHNEEGSNAQQLLFDGPNNLRTRYFSLGGKIPQSGLPNATFKFNGDIDFTGDLYKNGTLFTSGGEEVAEEVVSSDTGDNTTTGALTLGTNLSVGGNSIFTGNVGIGTDNPGAKLHIYDGSE